MFDKRFCFDYHQLGVEGNASCTTYPAPETGTIKNTREPRG